MQEEIPQRSLAQHLAQLADILRGRSANGLKFSRSVYDQENYRTVQNVALELMALATALPVEELEPLRATFFARSSPFLGGDAAIIDEAGRILLIQRSDNSFWAMPGGAFDVGETPAEGIVREALEETGVSCEAVALVGIHDSRLCGTVIPAHIYHILMLCRPLTHIPVVQPPSHALEVLGIDWFPEDGLPANLDPGHVKRIPEAFRVWRGDQRAYFDK